MARKKSKKRGIDHSRGERLGKQCTDHDIQRLG
jgi:hypothetical protein